MSSSWQSGKITTNGIQVYYTRTGGAGPAVVLAHGFSDDGLCWTPLARELAADYDVIMFDARGHGRSDAPEEGYDPGTQATDLAGAIAALELRRPAVLGHSMGAATALALAGLHADVPGAILLEDPPTWWLPNSQTAAPTDAERLTQRRAWLANLQRKTREELIATQRAATPGWSEAELGPWADAKLRTSPNVLNRADPVASLDWPATLRRITCPALLIAADPTRGALVTEEGAAALREFVPHLQVVRLPEAGHSIRRDQFDRYLQAVRAFLTATSAAR